MYIENELARIGSLGWAGDQTGPSTLSIPSLIPSKIRYYQIWSKLLSTAIISKVKSNLRSKILNFKADLRVTKEL